MSEYQYYEFQAIDRPLTEEEQQAVARLSSRVEPHPRQAVFVYHWSSFPGDPAKILAQYYDAMLYMANWGSRQLMFRFPKAVLDLDGVRAYCQPPIVEDVPLPLDGGRICHPEYRVPRGGGGRLGGGGRAGCRR